jgi:very-short-patch-repair endonuclease
LKYNSTSTRNRARHLRKSYTDAELRLWRLLRNRRLTGIKFRRQHPIDRYIADFVCLEHQLIIEVDGSQHAQQADYDTKRTAQLEVLGFRVLRFWDNDVLTNSEAVLQAIYDAINVAPHPSPLPAKAGRGNILKSK